MSIPDTLKSPRILLIPDRYASAESGGVSAWYQAEMMRRQGWRVGVFSPDIPTTESNKAAGLYRRTPFTAKANYFDGQYRRELNAVLDAFRPTHVFSAGVVIGRPLCYFDVVADWRIPHLYLVHLQDFYCSRIFAALHDGPCRKCLDGSKLHAFFNGCAARTTRNKIGFLANNTVNRFRLQRRLRKVDWVLGSTQEQLNMLGACGINRSKLVYFPLPFPPARVQGVAVRKGTDIVVAGAARLEKGIHLLRHLLPNDDGPRIRIAFGQREAGAWALREYGLERFVESGRLIPHLGVTWENGLKELYANSLGVLILSLWPTTTEFAFLEALGMAKPVVCFDVGVHAERMVDGKNGLKARLGDYARLRSHMTALQTNPVLYDTIADGAGRLFHELTDETLLMGCLRGIIS